MESVLYAGIILGVIGFIIGVFLAFASIKFKVEIDPKIEKIVKFLPGANCGGCGYPGCMGYATAVVENGAEITLCTPGGADVASKIGEVMGVKLDISIPKNRKVAKVLCQGDNTKKFEKFPQDGNSCKNMIEKDFGEEVCSYSCLGYGDCVKICPVKAITMNSQGIAVVDETKCISCALCVKNCPKNIINMSFKDKKAMVLCSSKDKGVVARKVCNTACLGCGICAKNCPEEAIIVQDNLAKIDSEKCVACKICVTKCPTKAIVI